MIFLLGHARPLRVRQKLGFFRTNVTRAAKQVAEKQKEPLTPAAKPETPSHAGSVPPLKANTTESDAINTKTSRARSIFPKFMRRYADRIGAAPVSHITSFLIVHELSAIVPLFGIWGTFYYLDYAPMGLIPNPILDAGVEFIRKMAERNDWQALAHAEKGSRIIIQGALSYGIVKAILPLRLVFSLWAMPWFARWFVVPVTSRMSTIASRLLKRK